MSRLGVSSRQYLRRGLTRLSTNYKHGLFSGSNIYLQKLSITNVEDLDDRIVDENYIPPVPFTWNELNRVVINNRWISAVNPNPRLYEDQIAMELHTKNVKKRYISMADYILDTYFNIPMKIVIDKNDNNIKKYQSDLNPNYEQREFKYVFIPNDFPYRCDEGITHDLLFATKPIESKDEINNLIYKHLKHKKYLWWENPLQAKSIPDLWHIHIMSLIPDEPIRSNL